jgi:uncharacterized protein (UPF0303 family)
VSPEDLLRKLEAEMETLRFESFNFDDALAIGLDLVETGRRKGRVAGRFFKSSLAIATELRIKGRRSRRSTTCGLQNMHLLVDRSRSR